MRLLIFLKNNIFKIERGLVFRFLKLFKFRPNSFPYITGDGFRFIADHVYDDCRNFNPKFVQEGGVIFVSSTLLKKYFENIHPLIKNKYKLISHNGDTNIDDQFIKYIDDKIIIWFAQNVCVKHEKIIPIPIGLENKKYYNNGVSRIFNKIRKKIIKIKKINKILFGFSVSTNFEERSVAKDSLRKSLLSDEIKFKLEPPLYLKLLSKYKFVASPEGNGIDCHRTWEAMYSNVIPIVKRSVMTEYFQSLGLPMLLINDWKKVVNFNENYLFQVYEREKFKFDNDILYFNYWHKLIKEFV